jgi:Zn-dependent peptidase ImmA (M78 family)
MSYRLTKLELLQEEALQHSIDVTYAPLPKRIKGLYCEGYDIYPVIALNKQNIVDSKEETCIVAEELGHYYTSSGDLLDEAADMTLVRKQEEKARRWAANRIISLNDIIKAYEYGSRTQQEFAEYLDTTEDFLCWAIEYYRKKYGIMKVVDSKYVIYFEPFGVLHMLRK